MTVMVKFTDVTTNTLHVKTNQKSTDDLGIIG
jgi:hypothetical protein